MVHCRQVQRTLWEGVLPDAEKLWSAPLRRIDALLEDVAVLEPVAQALARRWLASRSRGRRGTPVDVVLRMLVLKHLYRWSYDELEREVRANLVYRAFSRVGAGPVPDAKTILKLAQALGPDTIQALHRRVVELAIARGVTRGRRLRIDTTVVETHIHYPTDSNLLADGVRMLTRTTARLRARVGATAIRFRDRTRSLARRAFAISQRSRAATLRSASPVREQNKARMTALYREAMRITRAVVRDAEAVVATVSAASSGPEAGLRERLAQTMGLVRRVIQQTRARVLAGDIHYPDKVLSLVEPHTEAIRKGKASKLTAVGKLVKIQEAENQFITDYTVCPVRVLDGELWRPTLERHEQLFGRPPRLAVADGSFSSAANERLAQSHG